MCACMSMCVCVCAFLFTVGQYAVSDFACLVLKCFFFFCSTGWSQTHHLVRELLVLLSPPPEHWDCRLVPPYPSSMVLASKPGLHTSVISNMISPTFVKYVISHLYYYYLKASFLLAMCWHCPRGLGTQWLECHVKTWGSRGTHLT